MKVISSTVLISSSGGALLGGSFAGAVGTLIGAVIGATVGLIASDDKPQERHSNPLSKPFHYSSAPPTISPSKTSKPSATVVRAVAH